MSPALTQTLLAVLGGCVCLFAAGVMGRRKKLSLRYATGWSLLGVSAILFGALTPFLDEIAAFFNLSPAGLVLMISLGLILTILFMVSVSVVGLQRDMQNLAEEIALMKTLQEEETAR